MALLQDENDRENEQQANMQKSSAQGAPTQGTAQATSATATEQAPMSASPVTAGQVEQSKPSDIAPQSATPPTAAPTQTGNAGALQRNITTASGVSGQTASPKQQRKTTGFTNLNRIMQANVGNKLGQTLSSGITGQAQGVQQGINTANQTFEQQAQQARLDTPEAAAKRAEILGRFNQTTFTPDMSKFAVSQGLQSKYDTQKAALQQQQTAAQQTLAQQQLAAQQAQSGLTAQLATAQTAATKAQQEYDAYAKEHPGSPVSETFRNRKNALAQQARDAQNALTVLKTKTVPEAAQATQTQSQLDAYNKQLADLDKQFGTSSDAEKQAFIDAEQKRLQAAVLPTDEEIKDFTKYRTGTYTGPNELGDYGTLLSKAAQAEQLGGLTRSAGGRQELLRRFVGGEDYTQGQKRLDEALLGQDKSANLGAAARQTRGAMTDVERANQTAAGKAEEFKGLAKIFGEETAKQIQATKTPLSEALDKEVKAAQDTEATRTQNVKSISDIMSGVGDAAQLDPTVRLGLALTAAQKSGYLNDTEIQALVGPGGLVQRSLNLGLDPNKLILERIQNNAAKNVGRTGIASDQEIARLNALDKLAGKQGSDLEFLTGQPDYAAGSTKFDLSSLGKYIKQSEDEKAQKDAKYASDLAAERAKYLNQALGYTGGALGSGSQAIGNMIGTDSGLIGTGIAGTGAALGAIGGSSVGAGAGLGAGIGLEAATPYALAAMLGYDTLTGGDTTAQTVNALGNTGINTAGAAAQGSNALAEGLLKLNIGGKSIANTAVGQQLLKGIDYLSQNENKALQGTSDVLKDFTGGIGGLTSSGLQDILKGNIGNLVKNIGGATGINSGIRVVGNVGNAVGGAVKKVFCYEADTWIMMRDGKYKQIKDLHIGEEVALGGKITAIGEAYNEERYNYKGLKVSGGHAMFEDGRWVRVRDSKHGHKLPGTAVVYPMATEKHIIVAGKGRPIISSDILEVDASDTMNDEQKLQKLNSKHEYNNILKMVQEKYLS